MSMNKKLIYISLIILSIFIFRSNVFAGDCTKYGCVKCVYEVKFLNNFGNCSASVESDGNGNVTVVDNSCESPQGIYYRWKTIDSNKFINKTSNTLVCPPYVMYSHEKTNSLYDAGYYNFSFIKGDTTVNLSSKSTNNNLPYKVDNNNSSDYIYCNYGNITVKSNGSNLLCDNCNNIGKTLSFDGVTATDFKKNNGELYCPSLYLSCPNVAGNASVCTVSKEKKSYSQSAEVEGQESAGGDSYCTNGAIESGVCTYGCNVGYSRNNIGMCIKDCPDGYYADGDVCKEEAYVFDKPCSENSIKKTIRFFGYLLLIAKILIPLIIIGFAIFDFFKSVIDKDEQSLKKQTKQVIIRVISGLVVFFVPTFVSTLFSLSENLNLVNDAKYQTCVDCLLKPTNSSLCSISDNN